MLNALQPRLFQPLGQRFIAKTLLICSCSKGAYGRGKPVYRNRSDSHQIFTVNAEYNPVNYLRKKTVERLNLNSSEVLSAKDEWDPDGLFVLRSNDGCGCVRVSINFLREPHFWSCLRYSLAMDSGDCPRKNLVKSVQFRKVCRMGP